MITKSSKSFGIRCIKEHICSLWHLYHEFYCVPPLFSRSRAWSPRRFPWWHKDSRYRCWSQWCESIQISQKLCACLQQSVIQINNTIDSRIRVFAGGAFAEIKPVSLAFEPSPPLSHTAVLCQEKKLSGWSASQLKNLLERKHYKIFAEWVRVQGWSRGVWDVTADSTSKVGIGFVFRQIRIQTLGWVGPARGYPITCLGF